MRICFFGDIHGNSHALEACLEVVERVKADSVYCLGDLVGWLPFGDRTLTRMRNLNFPTVAGNHDLLVAGLLTDHPGQLDRMQATAYNAGLLGTVPGAITYLGELPLLLEREDFVVTHHSPFHLPRPGELPAIKCFDYLDEEALSGCLTAWRDYPKRLIFSGHDHLPAVYELPDAIELPQLKDVRIHRPTADQSLTIELNPDTRYWIKGGSVGGPYRDDVAAANAVVYDTGAGTVTLVRIPYATARLRDELASHRFIRNLPTIQNYLKLLASSGC
jgi:predicted phosphodiesterase